jgi:hypothetical protein
VRCAKGEVKRKVLGSIRAGTTNASAQFDPTYPYLRVFIAQLELLQGYG